MAPLVLALACALDDPPAAPQTTGDPGTVTIPEDRCAGVTPPCVDLSLVPPTVTADSGADVGPQPIGDVNGDSVEDWLFNRYVVFGPIHLPLAFPADADGTVVLAGWDYPPVLDFGDYDGDGDADLLSDLGLLAGPLAWPTVDLAASAGPAEPYPTDGGLSSWVTDLTGDGLVESVRTTETEIRVDPFDGAGWDLGDPSLVLRFSPLPDTLTEYERLTGLYIEGLPDVDGDGVRELCVFRPFGVEVWLIPADAAGLIEPEVSAPLAATCPTPVGDQDGDAVEDFEVVDVGVHRVLRGPLTIGPDAVTGEVLFTLERASPLRIDVSGDGVSDFAAWESPIPEVPNYYPYQRLALYTGGVGGGAAMDEPFVRLMLDNTMSLAGAIPTVDGTMLAFYGASGLQLVSIDELSGLPDR